MDQLYILAFDHRSSFLRMMGVTPDSIDADTHSRVGHFKEIIYRGFKMAVQSGVPKESAAILVDEFFGQTVLEDAGQRGYKFCLPVEKSGQAEFSFEYGDSFAEHINKYKPNIVKALVRYNTAGDGVLNQRQRARLQQLSHFCRQQKYPLMLEILVPPTPEQLSLVRGDLERYDEEIRPELMVKMVDELYQNDIEANVWKLEGLEKVSQYKTLMEHVRAGGRSERQVVILGREAAIEQIEDWFVAGGKVDGIAGFAVGRTIFEESIEQLIHGYLDDTKAIQEIAERYTRIYNLFIKYCR